jgi:hypothetical protein
MTAGDDDQKYSFAVLNVRLQEKVSRSHMFPGEDDQGSAVELHRIPPRNLRLLWKEICKRLPFLRHLVDNTWRYPLHAPPN